MILLVDIGNTRIKWATLGDGRLGPQHASPYADWTADDVAARMLLPAGRPERIVVSNVGGPDIGASLRDASLAAWGISAEFVQASAEAAGVRSGYVEPTQLGTDRWVALIGARHGSHEPACIVSVGTAMTIDGLDAAGRHLGGLILPGPALMVSALLRNTSDLAERSRAGDFGSGFFADNTHGAIHRGTGEALAALIERSVAVMAGTGGGSPQLLLTGGACHLLEPHIRQPFQLIPDLVLRGLAVLAAEAAGNR